MRRLMLLPLALIAAPAMAQIDYSGTITTAATGQTAIPAAPSSSARSYVFCQNPITATETLDVNVPTVAGAANGSFELAPGGTIMFGNGGFVPLGAVSVYAATAAHRFICKAG